MAMVPFKSRHSVPLGQTFIHIPRYVFFFVFIENEALRRTTILLKLKETGPASYPIFRITSKAPKPNQSDRRMTHD